MGPEGGCRPTTFIILSAACSHLSSVCGAEAEAADIKEERISVKVEQTDT